jgi:hypothetical protein
VFSAIAHDVILPKSSSTPAPSSGGAQVLTTSPAKVKVEVLNGSGISGIADQAAAGLTSRGFDVTGTGDAASSAYTNSVIEYSSSADLAEVNTLKKELSGVTDLQDASLKPGTVELILGSDFTGLNPKTSSSAAQPSPTSSPSASASPSTGPSSSSVTGLAQSTGGITAAAPCASDSSAFAGPLSP